MESGPLDVTLATGAIEARSEEDGDADATGSPEAVETWASGDASDRPGINR